MPKIIDFITAPSIADNDYIAMADASGNTRKVLKSNVIQIKNDLTATTTGLALDATQGKILDDKITTNINDIATLKDEVNKTTLTNIEIGSSPITSLSGILDGFVDSLIFKGKTMYKTSGGTYTDTYTNGVSLESTGQAEGKMIMTSLKPDNTVGDTLNATISKPLRSQGLVKDIYNITNKTITRYIGQMTFKGISTENWVLGNPPLQTNTLQFKIQIADGKIALSPTDINLMCDKFVPDTSANNISNDSECIAFDDNGYVLVRILKGKLATPDVAGFKLWLASVNTTIVYQLLNSVTETVKKVSTLQTFKDGYLQLQNAIIPTVNFNYSVELASVVSEHTRVIDELEDVVVDNVNKIGDLSTLTTTDKTSVVNSINKINTDLSERVKKSTVNITYYVNASTGNDANDGLTSGTALKTIQKAIDSLPQVLNHTIIINVAPGTYNEDIIISGFGGKGKINLNGTATCSIKSITVLQCSIMINVSTINIIGNNGTAGISIDSCINVFVSTCTITTASVIGVSVTHGFVKIMGCTISNCSTCAIISNELGITSSYNNSGTGNAYGLSVNGAGVIMKYGTQPTGTTQEFTGGGGVIR